MAQCNSTFYDANGNNIRDKTCRFCYNYVKPGFINPCCSQTVCDTAYQSTLAYQSTYVNNSGQTTSSSLLLGSLQKLELDNQSNSTTSTLQYISSNSTSITNNIYAQLQAIAAQRATSVYQTRVITAPEPSSVTKLKMETANVGVPHSVFTMADCKGSQFVTK
jgi:hypothetical protein